MRRNAQHRRSGRDGLTSLPLLDRGSTVSYPAAFSLVGFIVVASLGVFYSGVQPSYWLADQVPDKEQAVVASGR